MDQRIRKLLVATDLSERSSHALKRGILIAAEQGARLTVLHVIDEDLPSALVEKLASEAEILLRDQLRLLAAPVRPEPLLSVICGTGSREILRVANEEDVDLVILGIHRHHQLNDIFRGTTVGRVVRLGQRPCLVVTEPPQGAYPKVIVAVDFSAHSRKAFDLALRLAPNAEIFVVHVWDVPFKGFQGSESTAQQVREVRQHEMEAEMREQLSTIIRNQGVDTSHVHAVMKKGLVFEVLREEVARIGAGLLVMGTQGRTGVERAILGSVAENFLNDPPCDVLAVRAG